MRLSGKCKSARFGLLAHLFGFLPAALSDHVCANCRCLEILAIGVPEPIGGLRRALTIDIPDAFRTTEWPHVRHLMLHGPPANGRRMDWLSNFRELVQLDLNWPVHELALSLLPFKSKCKLPTLQVLMIGKDCQEDFYPLPYREAREAALKLPADVAHELFDCREILVSEAFLPLYEPDLLGWRMA